MKDVSSDCLGGELEVGVEDPPEIDSPTPDDWRDAWDGE